MRYGIIVVIRMNKIGSSSVVHRLKIKLAALAVLLLISFAGSLLLYSFVMALTGFAALSLHVFGGVMIDTNVFDMVSLAAFAFGAALGLALFIWMSRGALQTESPGGRPSRPLMVREMTRV
jgi:apolipoprotein N-acyltransferase